jgi:nucleoside-diphosphate-sugar epimerase
MVLRIISSDGAVLYAPRRRMRMSLVTGGSGFLGGAVLRELAAREASASQAPGLRAMLRASSDASGLKGLPVQLRIADLTRPETLGAAVSGVRIVYHCAGMLGQAGVPESAYERIHVDGTIHLLRAAAAAGVERVVLVSSPGVLGPIQGEPASEDAPYNPTNAYERSKAAAERAALVLAPELKLPLSVARPEFVYGPRDTHVLRLFQSIARGRFFFIGDGTALCHPTFVDDASRGIVDVGEHGETGRIYHLAGPRPATIRELVETLAAAMGVSTPRLHLPERAVRAGAGLVERVFGLFAAKPPLTKSAVDFFAQSRQFSWQRARTELGWSPCVELRDGVERTVRWYRAHGLLP